MAGLQIAISGNIGVGKSGLCAALAHHFGARAELESVDENPYFNGFYAEPSRWAFSSQLAFAAEALSRHVRAQDGLPVVMDRTIYEGVAVFGQALRSRGDLTSSQLRLFERLAGNMRALPRQPDLLIHLTAPIEVLVDRIAHRGRFAERNIDRAYLNELTGYYASFLTKWDISPIVSIDASKRDLRDHEGVDWVARRIIGTLGKS